MEKENSVECELNALRDRLLLMGGEVELALQRATQAIIKRDNDIANKVLSRSDVIDQLEIEIDYLGIECLTVCQPVEQQLRAVISIIKITPLLKRIASHIMNIALAALELNDEPEIEVCNKLNELAEQTLAMLQGSLDAFTGRDAGRAREIFFKGKEIDSIYGNLIKSWIKIMSNDSTKSARMARLLFVVKHLERIADYVKDICELTVYMKEAVFIQNSDQNYVARNTDY
jgi:phosphate transport system protein